ncbi:hypothetical protein AB0B04_18810 [Streptomyces xinghaiensis]|uniref:Uncharacterized protein n=1 Tax=Streptomyces xinghaiensis TaxID=1038928 RepID=A0A3R7HX36_9ACTN|nr:MULTISPECIES: hypothetical protein [Streptomyces]OFA48264.1 hypothetical protein BEN35_19180 [Streptomyces fradiae]PQM20667.1 hypothetical protein Sfr7A_26135 [Streptomyces xinghaiensis]RKM92607.1 hypothetical protein SFRA_024790 [Streptomyces xinghaiensis]RNC70575.1 hypothetical protein DC095_025780 [Streptomyces xinghaiensis]
MTANDTRPPHPAAAEQAVTTHQETAAGTLTRHATDRTVRAAIADAGNTALARINDTSGPDGEHAADGMLVTPRTGRTGHARVRFLEGGKPKEVRNSADLGGIAESLRAAGWIVHCGSRVLNIEATEPVWRADNARRTARDIYPAAHHFQPVTDGDHVVGWTFTTLPAGVFLYGWADGRGGMSGPLWDTRQQAAHALATHARTLPNPTTPQLRKIAALLVGDDVTLPPHILATIADARAARQDDKGGKSAASQYRHCAHHLRQAAQTRARADDVTAEDQAATADLTRAYLEAALTHAREANPL